jgi:hypothetical protein
MLQQVPEAVVYGGETALLKKVTTKPLWEFSRKDRKERKEAALLARQCFVNAADFFKHYLRLSGVLIRFLEEDAEMGHAVLWLNNQTKQAIPGLLRTALQRG